MTGGGAAAAIDEMGAETGGVGEGFAGDADAAGGVTA
jgi:hypothetical protein